MAILRLFEYLKENKISITELADKTGISKRTFHYWKANEAIPLPKLNDIADVLGVSIYELIELRPGYRFLYSKNGDFSGVVKS